MWENLIPVGAGESALASLLEDSGWCSERKWEKGVGQNRQVKERFVLLLGSKIMNLNINKPMLSNRLPLKFTAIIYSVITVY